MFLFFGLYQHVEHVRGKWQYMAATSTLHVLWGWLQVGGVHVRDDLVDGDFPWAHYVYDQPTGALHPYLWISPLGRPRLTSCEAPGSSPPKWG